MDYATLKDRQRNERHQHPINLALRTHRALSWLQRAEIADDQDGEFIFLWIAFNAAYATDFDERYRLGEQKFFRLFIAKLCALDEQTRRIEGLLWDEYPKAIRALLDNPYVFQSFWDCQAGKIGQDDWKERFAAGKKRAAQALGERDTPMVLGIVFTRLYTLRNQLMHGGATWGGRANRDQLRDCNALMGKLVPIIIEIMLDNPDTLWGDAVYPVVD